MQVFNATFLIFPKLLKLFSIFIYTVCAAGLKEDVTQFIEEGFDGDNDPNTNAMTAIYPSYIPAVTLDEVQLTYVLHKPVSVAEVRVSVVGMKDVTVNLFHSNTTTTVSVFED